MSHRRNCGRRTWTLTMPAQASAATNSGRRATGLVDCLVDAFDFLVAAQCRFPVGPGERRSDVGAMAPHPGRARDFPVVGPGEE